MTNTVLELLKIGCESVVFAVIVAFFWASVRIGVSCKKNEIASVMQGAKSTEGRVLLTTAYFPAMAISTVKNAFAGKNTTNFAKQPVTETPQNTAEAQRFETCMPNRTPTIRKYNNIPPVRICRNTYCGTGENANHNNKKY